MKLGQLVKKLRPSPTLDVMKKVVALKEQGLKPISLAVGEPHWPVPDKIKKALVDRVGEGGFPYAPSAGLPSLRAEISNYYKRMFGVDYKSQEVVVTPGCKMGIFASLQVLLDPEDEVILCTPYWPSYEDMVALSGGRPKIVRLTKETDFKLTPDILEKNLSPKVKAILLNTPSNPTGVIYTESDLKKLARVFKKNPQVTVMLDFIYHRLTHGLNGKPAPLLTQVCPEIKDQVIILDGASKSYSMTGLRLGWVVSTHAELNSKLASYLSQSVTSASVLSQVAAQAALCPSLDPIFEGYSRDIKENYNLCCEFAKSLGLSFVDGQGAFYFWFNVEPCLSEKLSNDALLAAKLVEETHVVLTPGTAFGSPGYWRLSLALDKKQLQAGLEKIKIFLSKNKS